MNTEELKQKALKCYGWRNASSAWLHESGDGSAVVGNIDDCHDPAMRNPVAVVDVTHYDGFQDDSIELAQFYAATNPATILALIAERDEAVRIALDAATSLETIHIRSYGNESNLNHPDQMRAYAGTRAGVVRKELKDAGIES